TVLNYGATKFARIRIHHNKCIGLGRGGIGADGGISYGSGGDESLGGQLPDLNTPERYLREIYLEDNYIEGTANITLGFTGGVINSAIRRNTFHNTGWSGA